jgi:signal transduction histidine kinase
VKERAENLRDFLSTISHDLKTPLTLINTSLYLLERVGDPVRQKEKIEAIQAQVFLLEKYINDILTISRLDHTPSFDRQPVDLNRLVRNIEQRLRPSVERKNLTTSLDLRQEATAVFGDEQELDRVLVNLIENAVNYTPHNGTVTIRTLRERDCVVAEITDTGIGIPENELPHIFERFYRATQARSVEPRGTGLGLAIVKRILELQGGSIEVQSIEGQGSTFRVLLPIAS